jgi:hypothetical protein
MTDTRRIDELRALVARLDPLLVEAAAHVDRTQLRDCLAMSPRERADACTRFVRSLSRFRDATPERR